MVNKEKLIKTLHEILSKFASGDYSQISRSYPSVHKLTAEEIKFAVEDYGCQITVPPIEEIEKIMQVNGLNGFSVIKLENAPVKKWAIDFPFWSVEEGLSQLEMKLHVTDTEDSTYKVELRDILVP